MTLLASAWTGDEELTPIGAGPIICFLLRDLNPVASSCHFEGGGKTEVVSVGGLGNMFLIC